MDSLQRCVPKVTTQTISTLKEQFRVQYHSVASNNYAILIPPLETGATMNNKIVALMFEVFIRLGWNVLRFDFFFSRPNRNSEMHDTDKQKNTALIEANYIVDWYTAEANAENLVVCGYASGAMLALEMLMRRPEINGFVAVGLHGQSGNNTFLAPCSSPGLFVHGKFDRIAPLYRVQEVMGKLQTPNNHIELQILEDDHFFNQHSGTLKRSIADFIKMRFGGCAEE